MGLKDRMIKDAATYFSSLFLAQIFLFVGGFLVARFLGPTNYGIWNGLQLILLYASYSQLGVVNALNREVPLQRGKGDLLKLERTRSAAFGVVVSSSLMMSGVVGLYSFAASSSHPPLIILGLRFMAMIVFLQQVYGYAEVCIRTEHDFSTVSRLRRWRAMLDMSLAAFLSFVFDLAGRLWAATLTWIAALLYVWGRRAVPFRPTFDLDETGRLIAIGLPIMLVGLVSGLFQTIDRVLILKFLGQTDLGYYGIGLMAMSTLGILPGVAAEILYPRLAERYGQTGSPSQLKEYVLTPTYLLAHLLPLFLGMMYLLIPYVILMALPKYAPAIKPARILILGGFFFAIAGFASDFLNTINKQAINLMAQIASLAIAVSSTYAFLRLGWGIQGVALATVLTSLLYSLGLLGYVLVRHFSTPIDSLKSLWSLYFPFIYCLGLLLLIDLIPAGAIDRDIPSLPVVLLKAVIFALLIFPLIAHANRRVPFLPELFELVAGLRQSVFNR